MREDVVLAVHTHVTSSDQPPERQLWVAGRLGVHRWRCGLQNEGSTSLTEYSLTPWARVGPVDVAIIFPTPSTDLWHATVSIEGIGLRHEAAGYDGKVPTSLAFARACLRGGATRR